MEATIISVAVPVVLGLFGAVFHNKHSNIKDTCIKNYSDCIKMNSPQCDKILEVCKGYIKIETKTTTDNVQEM